MLDLREAILMVREVLEYCHLHFVKAERVVIKVGQDSDQNAPIRGEWISVLAVTERWPDPAARSQEPKDITTAVRILDEELASEV